LKHAHILALLSVPVTSEDIDFLIQAQIPDSDVDPELLEAVTNYMLHGPCGAANPKAPCMEKGHCSKGYPKPFQETTSLPSDGHGYPLYARPNNGRKIEKNGFIFDNRWVVPYNRYLLLKYLCHVNFEFIGSFYTVKYIYKYVHKGADVSTVEIESGDLDEIQRFVNARTIDPHDAVWRIFGYKVQDRFPAVYQLAIHLEWQQNVVFKEGEEAAAVEKDRDTTLTAFFKFNQTEAEARNIIYQDFPKHCTFSSGKWKWRQTRPSEEDAPRTIGRINAVSPVQGERYFLRLLLSHKAGATSFDELKAHEGSVFPTFKATCLAMGLLDDDSEWKRSLEETARFASSKQIRSTFSIILQFCTPSEPESLWQMFKEEMSDDFLFEEMKVNSSLILSHFQNCYQPRTS
jgi:hypothetical protein